VTHTGGTVIVARSAWPVGVDAEVPKSRPAAFRHLSRATGASIVSIEQWTQAEALWKAAGQAHRRPGPGELVMPRSWSVGWNVTADGRWAVCTRREAELVWSCALPNDRDRRLVVHDLRDVTFHARSSSYPPQIRAHVLVEKGYRWAQQTVPQTLVPWKENHGKAALWRRRHRDRFR
jgi:hypothetical protein